MVAQPSRQVGRQVVVVDNPLLPAVEQEAFRPPRKALSAPLLPGAAWADYAAAGFRPCGARAIRIDAIEKLASAARKAAAGRDFPLDPAWAKIVGGDLRQLEAALKALGYRRVAPAETSAPARWRFPHLRAARPADAAAPGNAFGGLADLIEERRAKKGEGGA